MAHQPPIAAAYVLMIAADVLAATVLKLEETEWCRGRSWN
jgi:hypothetical protein